MERNRRIDLLKTIAIFGVVVIHMCGGGYNNPILSFDWISSVFWGSIARASVPIFFMCSGALLLSPQREFSLKKLYTKNLLRILVAMFVWALAYKGYHLLVAGTLTVSACYHAVKEVLLFKHEFHLYYLHILILVYVFLPVTRIFVKHASQKELKYALMVWFVLGIVFPTVMPFWPFRLLSGIPIQWPMNMTYAAIGYGVLGYYLSCYPPKFPKRAIALSAAGFAVVFGLTVFMSVKSGSLYQNFLEGMSVGVAMLATGLFGLCQKISLRSDGKVLKGASKVSKAGFCIYLAHVFVMHFFDFLHISVSLLPTLISIPLLSVANLLISLGCYWIASKIPVANRWLV